MARRIHGAARQAPSHRLLRAATSGGPQQGKSPPRHRPREGTHHVHTQPGRRHHPATTPPGPSALVHLAPDTPRSPRGGHRAIRRAVDRPPRRERAGSGAHAVAEPGPHRNPAGPVAAPPQTSRRAGRHPGRLPAAGPRPAAAARRAGRAVHRRRHPPPHHHGPGRHRHRGSDHRDALSPRRPGQPPRLPPPPPGRSRGRRRGRHVAARTAGNRRGAASPRHCAGEREPSPAPARPVPPGGPR